MTLTNFLWFVGGSWFGYFLACVMRIAARPRGHQPAKHPPTPIVPPPPPRNFAIKGGRNNGSSVKKPPAKPAGQAPVVDPRDSEYRVARHFDQTFLDSLAKTDREEPNVSPPPPSPPSCSSCPPACPAGQTPAGRVGRSWCNDPDPPLLQFGPGGDYVTKVYGSQFAGPPAVSLDVWG